MLSLCNPKYKVLNKEVKKPTLGEQEKISLNLAFKNANIRVNVLPTTIEKKPSGDMSASKADQELMDGIKRERNQKIDAHIVKQMKTNKTMMINDLQAKVMQAI